LKANGLTIIYTTHYMEEAQRLCDRVAIVDHGSLMALDSVDGLLDHFGGASVVVAEVDHVPDDLTLPGKVDQKQIRFESGEPLEEIAKLSADGVKFSTLQITKPDLESVFLSLTGRSLRD